jgi:hypothetical protein
LRLATIGKESLIAWIFVEDQQRLRKSLASTGDKLSIRGVARISKLVVLDQGEPALESLSVTFIGQ